MLLKAKLNAFGVQTQCFWSPNSMLLKGVFWVFCNQLTFSWL